MVNLINESSKKRITRAKAIRLKCLDCCCFQTNEVKSCPSTDCPLWRYRMGYEEKDQLYYQNLKSRKGEE